MTVRKQQAQSTGKSRRFHCEDWHDTLLLTRVKSYRKSLILQLSLTCPGLLYFFVLKLELFSNWSPSILTKTENRKLVMRLSSPSNVQFKHFPATTTRWIMGPKISWTNCMYSVFSLYGYSDSHRCEIATSDAPHLFLRKWSVIVTRPQELAVLVFAPAQQWQHATFELFSLHRHVNLRSHQCTAGG